MGYRTFVDTQGMDWQTWDVVPALADRRMHDRRTSKTPFDGDRRRAKDRRVTAGRRPALSTGLGDGWLCFEASQEKRRLTPIPSDWLVCALEGIRHYLALAKPATRLTTPLNSPILTPFKR
jgi:hypothetical protein